MRRTLIFLMLLCTSSFVIGQKDTVNQVDSQGLRTGYWIGLYPDGIKRYEGRFHQGNIVGEMTRYYENGSVKAILRRNNDESRVSAQLYDTAGFVRAAGYYQDQKKNGEWRFFGTRENVVFTTTYENDMLNGISCRYYINGIIQEKTNWENSRLEGLQILFNQNGIKQGEINYFAGRMDGSYKVFYSNGEIEIKGQFSNNLRVGKWSYFRTDGSLNYQLSYRNGVLLNPEVLTKEQEENFKRYDNNRTQLKDPRHYLQDPVSYFRK